MHKSFIRSVAVVVVSSALVAPGESRACCFCDWFKCGTPAPTYATQYVAPACNVCPQQVSYVPQTNYTTQYQCVPVTACQPVSSCDPCGGSQTVMRPVTTYVRRPVMVPYTTYRPVVTQLNYAPAPACSSCGSTPYYGGANYAPAAMAAPAASCPTCGGGMAATTYGASYGAAQANYVSAPVGYAAAPANYAGAPANYAAAPANYGAAPANYNQPMYTMPMNSAPQGMPTPAIQNGGAPATTFQQQPAGGATQSNLPMSPVPTVPDPDKTNSSMSAPRFPDAQNRTTSTGPLIGPATVVPAIFNTADRNAVFHPASLNAVQPALLPSDGFQSTGSR